MSEHELFTPLIYAKMREQSENTSQKKCKPFEI